MLAFVFWGSSPGASQSPGAQVNETPSAWFVELARAPLADVDATFTQAQRQSHLATLAADKQAFRNAARAAGVGIRERRSFDVLFNGLAIDVAPTQLPALARVQGVKALWPVLTFSLPPTRQVLDPAMATALAMTGADIAQSELGLTGTGVRVAVMDTGVDYQHPDLGGCFGPGCRVAVGWDFVGDAFNADPTSPGYNPVPVPDPDPDDCNGHGTHVAGIVGASGNFATGGARGVAPDVTFGAYRVFGCEGSTTADIMIAAMERALADGMHVLNMSIGSAFQWPQYPTAAASDRLVNKGMVVVASFGNSGANGVYSGSSPGLGSKVIGVASYDNSHVALTVFTISPDNTQIGYGNAAAAPTAPTSGSLPMSRTGTPTTPNDACAPLPAGSQTGNAVLIRRGTCTFHTKALNAQNAGASAVVLYNNVGGRFSPTVAGTPAITIPVVAISDTEGVLINDRLAAGPVTMTWTNLTGTFVNPTGGLISSFSSYGLSPDLVVKPDIGAPGGLIRSTYPLEQGGYATISGTSMSSPHVAGGVALLLQARPRTPSQIVRTILQNSADPKNWWGNPALGFLDNVHRQGAGMLDIDDAILATTKIEPGKLSLGESEAGPAQRTLTIENNGPAPVTYNLSHQPALATGPNTFTPAFFNAPATVAFSPPSVTVPAGATATVNVTITAPAGLADRSMYGGYIVFTPTTPGQVYRVPYAGFKGDYQSIQAVTPTASGFPWLAKLTACTKFVGPDCVLGGVYANQAVGATYTLADGFNVPYILVHLDHQVRKLRMEVFDANTGRAEGRALDLDYVGRNSMATSFFALPWDGMTMRGQNVRVVPDGQYRIRLSVQKALGDDNNPAHWESWTSPVITLDRP
ncbi:MAG: peptidase S8 [Armatimonadetes bacterium RBG_16_67_12]|nr:MAG: peptidase S8 [Armatimonadetes bacterium RBG_16_67_12]